MEHRDLINLCNNLSNNLTNDIENSFSIFKNNWDSCVNENDLSFMKDTIFIKQVFSLPYCYFENDKILKFLEEKYYLIDSSEKFKNDLNYSLFVESVSQSKPHIIKKFLPHDFDLQDCINISIKYSATESFDFCMSEFVSPKQFKKILNNAQKETWSYISHGFSSFQFLNHILNKQECVPQPVKQPFYDIVSNSNFDLLNDFINEDYFLALTKDLNWEHFFKLICKSISQENNLTNYNLGLQTLLKLSEIVDFDFNNLTINKDFWKNNPEIKETIDKITLKQKYENKEINSKKTVFQKI